MKILALIVCLSFLSNNSIGQNVLPFKKKNQEWCFVDTALTPINTKTYKEIVPISMGYFMVKKRRKYALVTNLGVRVTGYLYKDFQYSNRFLVAGKIIKCFVAHKQKSEQLIDMNGNKIKNASKDRRSYCGGAFASGTCFEPYSKKGKIGFVNFCKNMISGDTIPGLYEDYKDCYNGYIFVKQGGKWGLLNSWKGKIIDPVFQDIRLVFSRLSGYFNCAYVQHENKWGWMNSHLNLTIPPQYKEISSFKFGYATVVTMDNRSGSLQKPA